MSSQRVKMMRTFAEAEKNDTRGQTGFEADKKRHFVN
jgi:hypothetical protein